MRRLIAILVIVLLSPAGAAAAYRGADPAGDVLSGSPEADTPPRRPAPRVALGDATAVRIRLGRALLVTTTYRALPAVGYQRFSWVVRTASDDPGSSDWWISYDTDPGQQTGALSIQGPQGADRHCGTVHLDRSAGTATLTLTEDCIGRPAWVRVGTGLSIVRRGTYYEDDAQREGSGPSWRWGPRIESRAPATPRPSLWSCRRRPPGSQPSLWLRCSPP